MKNLSIRVKKSTWVSKGFLNGFTYNEKFGPLLILFLVSKGQKGQADRNHISSHVE